MPDAPAPTPDLSSTTMSAPLPAPRASSSLARCQAVERPCMPAPMMTYGVWAGVLTAHLLPTARVPAGLQVGCILPVALGDARVAAEERVLRHVRRVPGRGGHLSGRLGHGAYVGRGGAAADAEGAHAEGEGGRGELAQLVAGGGGGGGAGGGGARPPPRGGGRAPAPGP